MVKVDVIGVKEIVAKLNKAPQVLKNKVGFVIQTGAEEFRDLAIKDAPKDTGSAGLSGKITKKKIDDLRSEVVSGSEYSAPMEFGTKGKFTPIPGVDMSEIKWPKGGSFKDFVRLLTNWVHRKNLKPQSALGGTFSVKTKKRTGSKSLQQRQDYQIAYVIARSILKNGVTPHPFFFKQIPIVRKNIIDNAIAVLDGIL